MAVVAEPVLKPGIGDDDEEDGNSLRDLYLIVFTCGEAEQVYRCALL